MAREEVSSAIGWQPDKHPTTGEKITAEQSKELGIHETEGHYVNRQENQGPNNSVVHTLKTEDGQMISFWGCTTLDDKLSNETFLDRNGNPTGMWAIIEFTGLKESKTPGRSPFKTFNVYRDTEKGEAGYPVGSNGGGLVTAGGNGTSAIEGDPASNGQAPAAVPGTEPIAKDETDDLPF